MATKAESARDPESGVWWDESASPRNHAAPRHYVQPPMDTTHSDDDNRDFDWDRVAHIVLAVLLPPLGVFFETGCDKNFVINVLLTLLGYIPGIIHALYVILTA